MAEQVLPDLRLLIQTEHRADGNLERVEAFYLQEQFTGPVPLRNERPAAELLAERLAGADPASTSLLFIP